MKERFSAYINQLQDSITSTLEEIDGTSRFQIDDWNRPGGVDNRVSSRMEVFLKKRRECVQCLYELPDSMKSYLKVEHGHFFAWHQSYHSSKIRWCQLFMPTFATLNSTTTIKRSSINGLAVGLISHPTICLMRMLCIFISSASRFVMRTPAFTRRIKEM